MSTLTEKEISHFADQLPKGMAVVDFRSIEDANDFLEKYLPKDYSEMTFSDKTYLAIEAFIEKIKS